MRSTYDVLLSFQGGTFGAALRRIASGIEKINQLREAARPQVAELALVALFDGFIQSGEDLQACRSNLCRNHSPVQTRAGSNDQAPSLEPIQQAGDVRIVSEHALRGLVAAQAVAPGAAQNAQNVVLSAGQAEGFDDLLGAARQGVRRTQEAEVRFVLERTRRLAWLFGLCGW